MRVFSSNWIFQSWTVLWLLLLNVVQNLPLEDGPKCDAKYEYEHEGRCCSKCEPGYHMSSKCTAVSESVCLPCEEDEYMEHWNMEDRCEKQMYCDPGKGFIQNPSTVKAKLTCVCKPGYHCSVTCEFCQEDMECPPGYGMNHDANKTDDIKCERCHSGYFSNVSSSWEACIPWTNCTAIRKLYRISGTETSDAVCIDYPDQENNIWIALSVAILSAVIIGAFSLLIICYKKNGNSLSASLQHCLSEACSGKDGNQDPYCNNEYPHGKTDNEVLDLLNTKEEKKFSKGRGCIGHLCEGAASSSCCSSESETSMGEDREQTSFTLRGPTEDEYVEQNVPPYHNAPLQAEESDSFGQNTPLLQDFHDSGAGDHSLETAADDNHLPNKSLSTASKNIDSSLTASDPLCCSCASFESSKQPHKNFKDSYNFITENGGASSENWFSLQGSHCMDCKNITNNPSNSGIGKEQPFNSTPGGCSCSSMDTCGTDKSSTHCSCDQQTASGNVSGTNNTTFISSGQVMNFKGDVIVVYVSQNSQDSENVNGSSLENLVSPVQEENPNHDKSFAGNPQETRGSFYTDSKLASYPKMEQKSTGTDGFAVEVEFSVDEMHHADDGRYCQNIATLPVQEEGYPNYVLKEEHSS